MTTIDKLQLQYESLKLFEKQFNSIEKQVINYIYNKYLNTDNSEVIKTVSGNKTEKKKQARASRGVCEGVI